MSDRICDYPNCERPHASLGLCRTHYNQQREGKPLTPVLAKVPRPRLPGQSPCSVASCIRASDARGLCKAHYKSWRRGTLPTSDAITVEEKFFAKVRGNGDCWEWIGARDGRGYGRFMTPTITEAAHRWAYRFLRADIPDGLVIDHLCRNRACVNPWHLEPVPNGVNILRGLSPTAINARKTHCIHGHEFTPENTNRYGPGWRGCRACRSTS